MQNAVNWFDIPVSDMARAKAFYSKVLDGELQAEFMMADGLMSILPHQDGVGGALVQSESMIPSQTGSLIYLNGGDDLSIPLNRVESAGGQVLMDKMSIGENGFIAFFLDTEGNKVGLHSFA